jgi:hypothetical protein
MYPSIFASYHLSATKLGSPSAFFFPVYLRTPKIVMTSFFPTDAIRSRLEWNATLNPAAAPQTTEATKFLRKVIKPDTANIVFFF